MSGYPYQNHLGHQQSTNYYTPQRTYPSEIHPHQHNQNQCYNGYSQMQFPEQVPYRAQSSFNVNASPFVPSHQLYQQHYQHQQLHNDYYQQRIGSYQQPSGQSYMTHPPHSQMLYTHPDDQEIDAFATFGFQSQQYIPSEELTMKMQTCNAHMLLNEILVGCEQLISESEDDSQTWITAIRQRFNDPAMDIESKKVAVQLIVEISYSMEANLMKGSDPQYTFACLLQTIEEEMEGFMFHVIIPVIQDIHMSRNALENPMRMRLAIFLSEIYIKVTLENGCRFVGFGEALCDQLDDIVSFNPSEESVKCLLRVFKVSGAELDASDDFRLRTNDILTRMGGFVKGCHTLEKNIKDQIQSLIDCRQRGWDRAPISKEATSSGKYRQETDEYEERFELTEDENVFLESQLDALGIENDAEDYDDKDFMKEYGKFVIDELQQREDSQTDEMMKNLNVSEESPCDNTTPPKEDSQE